MKWNVALKLIDCIDSQIVVRQIWDVSKIFSRDLWGQNYFHYDTKTWFAFSIFSLSWVCIGNFQRTYDM